MGRPVGATSRKWLPRSSGVPHRATGPALLPPSGSGLSHRWTYPVVGGAKPVEQRQELGSCIVRTVVTAFIRSCRNSLRHLFVRAVEQYASPVRAKLIEHLGESISILSHARLSLVGPVSHGLDPSYGWSNAYEASHDDGDELTHVGHDAGRCHDAGLDEPE